MKFKVNKLDNGIEYILAPLKETQAITALVLVRVGSRYETLPVNGISHFIEHLLFKGSKKRPTSLHISKVLDGLGADYNAFTSKQNTGYYIKAAKKHLELSLDVLSDMLFNPIFEAGEIEKERGVILEEINMYEDNPLMHIGGFFEEAIFAGHPLGWQISGPREVIKNVKRQDILNFYKKAYLSNRIIIGLAGNFENDQAEALLKKYFGQAPKAKTALNFKKYTHSQSQPRVKIMKKDSAQVQVALGFPAINNLDPRLYALTILAIILGGGMSSRLFTEIREKRGLCYFVRASTNLYEDAGNFVVQAGLDQARLPEALATIKKELLKVVQKGVSREELKRAKEFLKGKLILQLEESSDIIHWLADQRMLTGKIETLETQLKKIDLVTLEQVKKIAGQVIKFNKSNLALIGPFEDIEPFIKILKG